MKKLVFAGFLIISTLVSAQTGKVYLFSYFTGNGEDGLHFAYSLDGVTFTALNSGKSFLKEIFHNISKPLDFRKAFQELC